MSKLACPCGEIICDNTDHLPYKGHLFADTEFFGLFESVSKDIAGFMAARLSGTERKWLAEYFGNETPMSDEDLAHTIIARYLIHAPMSVYQCQRCGRVHIQHRDGSMWFERFTPEVTPHRDVFKK